MLDATSPSASGGFVPTGWRPEPEFRWYVVNTEFQKELLVLQQIRRAKICAWLPEMLRAGRIVPLFQRYLLAQFDLAGAQSWRWIYGMIGVRTILGTRGERPQPLPAGAAEMLMQQAAPSGVMYVDADARPRLPPIAQGAKVRVTAGAFAGLEGIVRLSGRERVAVLLQVLGREVQTSVPRRDVIEVVAG